ncbi:MAG: tRNA (adenosine(37)-N6)-threonylcarbamoyltransferase complex transferase subunit TsaD [Chitinophagales bacterium]
MDNTVRILGIETSCDETAVAIVENGNRILSHLIASQIDVHQRFGGVVPEVASRKHIEVIAGMVAQAFAEAGLKYEDVTAVAVTNTPGLIGALLVGVSLAKSLAYGLEKPLIPVNHLEAHIYANFLANEPPVLPAICLVVSGGHTSLLYMKESFSFEVLGETRDDAAGEAFDKVARFLGLGYPGGPAMQKVAAQGQPGRYKLPRAYLDRQGYEFSFSGLKTATMNLWNQLKREGEEAHIYDLAAEFQEALVDVLVEKTIHAAEATGVRQILVAGGVAANSLLRERLHKESGKRNLLLSMPEPALCTDNAAMVGCAGFYRYLKNDFGGLDLNASPNFEFDVKNSCG